MSDILKIETDQYTLYNCDCMDVLATIKADCVVTDPPYGMNWPCDMTRFSGGNQDRSFGIKREQVINDDRPFDPVPWLNFNEVILWGYNHFASKLPVGTTLVWIKRLDGLYGTFLSDAELAWMKGGHGVYCQRDVSMYSKYADSTKDYPDKHPTEKPVGIMEWCIEKCKSDTIFDPYMGSGTTGVACARLGRKFIGIEIDKKYFDIAVERIDREHAQGKLFDTAD